MELILRLEYIITVSTDYACDVTSGSSELDNVLSLLSPVENKCFLLNRGWWTFRFCYLIDIAQIHAEVQKTVVKTQNGADKEQSETVITASYELGKYDPFGDVPTQIVKGQSWDTSYVQQVYSGGTPCDLNEGKPRLTTVKIFCNPNGETFAIRDITETKTCVYEMKIFSNLLCKDPSFAPAKPKMKEIVCTPRGADPDEVVEHLDIDDSEGSESGSGGDKPISASEISAHDHIEVVDM